MMCRARSREYQRKRQNLQGKHTRLDDELLEAQSIGTPLSKVRFYWTMNDALFTYFKGLV